VGPETVSTDSEGPVGPETVSTDSEGPVGPDTFATGSEELTVSEELVDSAITGNGAEGCTVESAIESVPPVSPRFGEKELAKSRMVVTKKRGPVRKVMIGIRIQRGSATSRRPIAKSTSTWMARSLERI
jgi:hypothetical protein